MNSDWSQIGSSAISGAQQGLEAAQADKASKMALKERKRRQIAQMLNQAFNRSQNTMQSQQEYGDSMSDFQAGRLQDVARGFADSIRGIRERTRR